MGRYVARRVAAMVPTLFVVTVVVFGITTLTPGDPARIYAGQDPGVTEEYLAQVRAQLGLDQPVYVQYLRWLGRAVHGDFGTSALTKQPVAAMIGEALPRTVYLTVSTMLLALAVSVPCGILAAVRRDSRLDLFVTMFSSFGIAMPSFWLALLLILLFAVRLGWFPAFGYESLAADPLRSIKLMVLPALTLGLTACASITRQLRSSMLKVLASDYLRTARAKGLPERLVLLRHALRSSMVPVITIVGIQATILIGGTVVTESIFAIPGLGRLAVDAITAKDYPVLMSTILVIAMAVMLINMVVDISYSLFDPRIRLG